ncbi:autoinducer binding domain-containing protein [Chitinimonas koreensis]|uniref:autoinducer binding domain-containing protein n=1 Tax=Chitinimonas koreensis TaxID=356302 RepID=UPI00042386FE|nr:autoinducer binding domain-containing protein [Chitinimonas koreensis]QNM96575.1 autoinducer binding domain-containing protein [Chitinimonas koreensis]
MSPWLEDQLHTLDTMQSPQALFDHLARSAAALGFDYCAYGLRMPLPLTALRIELISNYPRAWQSRYAACNYLGVDPTVQHGVRSPLPITWSDRVFADAAPLWEDARAYGLRHGWAQSSRDGSGLVGMLTLARSAEPIGPNELRDKGARLSTLATLAHAGMSRQLRDRVPPEREARLSGREIEVLRWTADGKTSGEIAQILGITERTVNFHIGSTLGKLNAANKTAAVVKAALLGLLAF